MNDEHKQRELEDSFDYCCRRARALEVFVWPIYNVFLLPWWLQLAVEILFPRFRPDGHAWAALLLHFRLQDRGVVLLASFLWCFGLHVALVLLLRRDDLHQPFGGAGAVAPTVIAH